MPVQDNRKQFQEMVSNRAALCLLKAAAILVSEYQINVTKSFPPASRRGEFPRFRTGTGRSAAAYRPDSVGGVIRNDFKVDAGLLKPGLHMAWLELAFGRLGFNETFRRSRSRLE